MERCLSFHSFEGTGLEFGFLGRVRWAGGQFSPGRAWARARDRPRGGVTPFPFCCDAAGFFPFLLATILPPRSNVPAARRSNTKMCATWFTFILGKVYMVYLENNYGNMKLTVSFTQCMKWPFGVVVPGTPRGMIRCHLKNST